MKSNRKSNISEEYSVYSNSIRRILEGIRKAFGKETFQSHHLKLFGLFPKHTENIWKANGKHLVVHWERTYSEEHLVSLK